MNDPATADLQAHVQGCVIRLASHVVARPRDPMGVHHIGPELWALRQVRWKGAAATVLHDARGQLPVLPAPIVAEALRALWPAVA